MHSNISQMDALMQPLRFRFGPARANGTEPPLCFSFGMTPQSTHLTFETRPDLSTTHTANHTTNSPLDHLYVRNTVVQGRSCIYPKAQVGDN